MLKTTILFLFSLLFSLASSAQRVELIYPLGLGELYDEVVEVERQGGQFMHFEIKGDLIGKRLSLNEHLVGTEKTVSKTIYTISSCKNNSFIIKVIKKKNDKNEVNIDIYFNNKLVKSANYLEYNGNYHILMATYSNKEYQINDTIPIFAYTNGVVKKIEWGGKIMSASDYEKVRSDKSHPSLWKEKFRLDDFMYFTIKLE